MRSSNEQRRLADQRQHLETLTNNIQMERRMAAWQSLRQTQEAAASTSSVGNVTTSVPLVSTARPRASTAPTTSSGASTAPTTSSNPLPSTSTATNQFFTTVPKPVKPLDKPGNLGGGNTLFFWRDIAR